MKVAKLKELLGNKTRENVDIIIVTRDRHGDRILHKIVEVEEYAYYQVLPSYKRLVWEDIGYKTVSVPAQTRVKRVCMIEVTGEVSEPNSIRRLDNIALEDIRRSEETEKRT